MHRHTNTHPTHRAETTATQFWIYICAISLSPPAGAEYGAVPAAVWCQQCFSRHRLHLLSKELCGELVWPFQCHLSSPAAPWQTWAKHQIPKTGTMRAVSITQTGSRPGTPPEDRTLSLPLDRNRQSYSNSRTLPQWQRDRDLSQLRPDGEKCAYF